MSTERIAHLREEIAKAGIDWLIISQANHVRYLSGYSGSNGLIVLSANSAYFLTDFRYKSQSAEEVHGFDIKVVDREIWTGLSDLLPQGSKVGFEKFVVTVGMLEKLTEMLPGRTLVPVANLLQNYIAVKSHEEIAAIQKAIDLAEMAFQKMLTKLQPGVTETDMAAELEYLMKKAGADPSFETIVASVPAALSRTGGATSKMIRSGELVTFDFGALLNGYCSDITRTVAVGEVSEKHREVYNIVLKAQIAACQAAKPGMIAKDLDAVARQIIDDAGYKDNFGHGLGHGLGLLVHDGPAVSSRSETVLEAGMVVTIEPGIYIEDFGGVRIEDDIVLTETGCRVMTSLPKSLIIL